MVAIVIALALVAGVGLHRAWSTCGFQGCPDVRGLTSRQIDGASLLLDRNGEPFANLLATEPRLVPVATLPATMRDAILAVEDRRFYEHKGVDWPRVIGAARANLRARRFEQGFSTITMQLARNLFPDRIPGRVRSLGRKLLEVRVAREIEQRFGKDEILELYLNHISFGQGARGIEAAAHFYFGRPAASLSLAESALLAALPKAPRHYDPRARPEAARVRRDLVLQLMEKQGRVSPELARAARAEPLGVTPFRRRAPRTRWAAGTSPRRFARSSSGSSAIRSTRVRSGSGQHWTSRRSARPSRRSKRSCGRSKAASSGPSRDRAIHPARREQAPPISRARS